MTPATEMSEPAKTSDSADSNVAESVPSSPEVPRLRILAESFIQKNPSNRSCFVLGATGETGRRIAKLLIESEAFSLVRLIVRRQVPEEFLPEPSNSVKIVAIECNCKLFQNYLGTSYYSGI